MLNICPVCKKPVYSKNSARKLYHGDVRESGSCNNINAKRRNKKKYTDYQRKAIDRVRKNREGGYDNPDNGDDTWLQG